MISGANKNPKLVKKNTERQITNQQGLETKKIPELLIPPQAYHEMGQKAQTTRGDKKLPIELSQAGQKLRNQINHKVTMGGKTIKADDASKIKW